MLRWVVRRCIDVIACDLHNSLFSQGGAPPGSSEHVSVIAGVSKKKTFTRLGDLPKILVPESCERFVFGFIASSCNNAVALSHDSQSLHASCSGRLQKQCTCVLEHFGECVRLGQKDVDNKLSQSTISHCGPVPAPVMIAS